MQRSMIHLFDAPELRVTDISPQIHSAIFGRSQSHISLLIAA